MIDATHAPERTSWVASANGHSDFPIQNLPFGVFSSADAKPRGGVAIGDEILDISRALDAGVFNGLAREAAFDAAGRSLNRFLALGRAARAALRMQISDLLDVKSPARPELLHQAEGCKLHLPAHIGGYTDFYTGINHAHNVGSLFRPENPLLPNYKYLPIGYHGRASSICPSGRAFHRPCGQRASEGGPIFGPSARLDYELELGIWVGPGNDLGAPVPIGHAEEHIAGFCLLNDWSARDFQAWEYQPLGPFLGKNFATTISPWIITPEALAPFRAAQQARPFGDPVPLPYLYDGRDQAQGAIDLRLEVWFATARMRAEGAVPYFLAASNTKAMYWTVAQLVTHHTSGGCNLETGDLLGSGTISGAGKEEMGSLLELTLGGREAISLPNGETRIFLEDGDEIIMRARTKRPGAVSIGFGACSAVVLPAG